MWISKHINLLANLVVGIVFLFSGTIKLNDSRGFSYKIEEYLHLLASQLTPQVRLLLPYTLVLAVCIATLEVVLGVALLVHWQHFWTLRALLLLTFFFTCLTLYTATSKRIASCGCFGNALKLTPWQSFTKSVVLLLLLGGLCWQEQGMPISLHSYYWVAAALLLSLGLSRYTLRHLPLWDFLPYKVGSDLSGLIQPQVPLRYVYVIKKGGQITETEYYPQKSENGFVSARLVNPEDTPRSTHLRIWKGGEDTTQGLLTGHKLLIIAQNPASIATPTLQKLYALIHHLPAKELQPILITPSGQGEEVADVLGLPLHTAHPLLLQIMLRAPLGLLLLQEGIVVNKWNFNDFIQIQNTVRKLGWLEK
jgi:uncharacterized membrane protein YphA (DoxX/SURF4 family)